MSTRTSQSVTRRDCDFSCLPCQRTTNRTPGPNSYKCGPTPRSFAAFLWETKRRSVPIMGTPSLCVARDTLPLIFIPFRNVLDASHVHTHVARLYVPRTCPTIPTEFPDGSKRPISVRGKLGELSVVVLGPENFKPSPPLWHMCTPTIKTHQYKHCSNTPPVRRQNICYNETIREHHSP